MSTHNIPFSIYKKKITLNYPKSTVMGFSKGLKNEFETVVVKEPSMFEPLKFYCTLRHHRFVYRELTVFCKALLARPISVSHSPGLVPQSVARMTKESEVPSSKSGPATYFRGI